MFIRKRLFHTNRLIFAISQGAIPIKITIIDHKFPVVISYAFNNALIFEPVAKSKIVSKQIVKTIHKRPIFQYVLCSPFPIRGIKINETIKISKRRIMPLIG
jgi:hypothetical protein